MWQDLPWPLRAAVMCLGLCAAPGTLAFDDREFCAAARQFARAAEQDIGIWIDRATRNAGMAVSCERREVEIKRFSYAASATMTADWKALRESEWNRAQCGSALWAEAAKQGWKIALSITAADGGHALFIAQCAPENRR